MIAVNGDAMSLMGRVIAFDLACLAASLSGIGQLPGIWIHDYAKLFRFAVELETLGQIHNPSFQNFVSTAGSVHSDIAPFVVLELDRREAKKTLLKRYFYWGVATNSRRRKHQRARIPAQFDRSVDAYFRY